MLILGSRDHIYFLHLAMRSPSPHQFQLIMKTSLAVGADTAIGDRTFVGDEAALDEVTPEAVYFADRNHADNNVHLYTFQPSESFVLTEIPTNERTSFTGDVVRGHFERDAEPPSILRAVRVQVEEILYFEDLRRPLEGEHPRDEDRLEFLLFGGGDEFFLSHRITLHGTQDEPDDNAFHQVFRLSPATVDRLRFGAERNALQVDLSAAVGTPAGRLPEDGGVFEASLLGLVAGVDMALPLTLDVGPEHYLEVLF